MEERYKSKKFMTVKMLDEILSAFSWPAPYTLLDGLPNHIVVRFPLCDFSFEVGFEAKLHLGIWPYQRDDNRFGLNDALLVLVPEAKEKGINFPVLRDFPSKAPSKEKTQHEISNLCIVMQTYLLPSIQGDFSWIEKYDEIRNRMLGD